MNKAKLTALCAKVRGISPSEMAAICYDPPDDTNQADGLLEYVANGRGWCCGYDSMEKNYWCRISDNWKPSITAATYNLAKILCALRASDRVTDAEIEEALK